MLASPEIADRSSLIPDLQSNPGSRTADPGSAIRDPGSGIPGSAIKDQGLAIPMLPAVLRTIRRHDMRPPGGRAVVALSGGADSVALLYILRELEQEGHLVLAGLAHFNHQLRGEASDADEQFCRELAASLTLPIEVGRG